jgi:hypothetical protein
LGVLDCCGDVGFEEGYFHRLSESVGEGEFCPVVFLVSWVESGCVAMALHVTMALVRGTFLDRLRGKPTLSLYGE